MKRFLSAMLSVALLVLVIPIASASGGSSSFVDVPQDAWYADALDFAVERGFVKGTSHNTFSPDMKLTRAQFVTMLGRLFATRIDAYDRVSFDDVDPNIWYAEYVSWAYQCGYVSGVTSKLFEPDSYITFEQMGKILDNYIKTSGVVLPESPVEYNDEELISDWAKSSMEVMAQYGLILPDAFGNVNPGVPVTRADCVVSLSFLAQAIETVNGRIPDDPLVARDVFSQFIIDNPQKIASFDINDKQAWLSNLGYMFENGLSSMDLDIRYVAGCKAFASAVSYYNFLGCRISLVYTSDKAELRIKRPDSGEKYRALLKAREVYIMLKRQGVVSADMPQIDRARVYYDWLIDNCEYDFDALGGGDEYLISHTAYGALVNHLAVCDGYTAAYNLLLSLDGIQCGYTRSYEPPHAWSEMTVDNVVYHTDVTWGDTTGRADDYFAMTPAESLARFR